eukprot:jgi/Ulvmu1/3909/UM018_0131.1
MSFAQVKISIPRTHPCLRASRAPSTASTTGTTIPPGRMEAPHRDACSRMHSGRGATVSRAAAGSGGSSEAIRREVLTRPERTKLDPEKDTLFYEQPRFVTHVDDNFIAQLTQLYRERIPEGAAVLDLMSSWVSHLPRERCFGTVYGHGMNQKELLANDQLDEVFMADLNRDPTGWPIKNGELDAVVCCVSVQYLQRPEEVFAEIARVLKPGGVCIVSFSNRMFYDKAIAAWRDASDRAHVSLVKSYFQTVKGFGEPEAVTQVALSEGAAGGGFLQDVSRKFKQLLQGGYQDPFFAIIAYKEDSA